ncbi:hypothetical protein B0H19DRAFT_61919 [Mycena capillaripes]|nr:hypothetical protein B0H19DRAFT_61919 [Mycena capillaripes]
MPQSDGFSAWITVEGAQAPEFDVRAANKTVTCWIPSEVGKKFSLHWSNLSVPGLTGGRVVVDGHNCDGQILAQTRRPTSTSMSGINETTTSLRHFMFGSLDITDDDAVPESNPDESLGTIALEIWNVEKKDVEPSIWAGMMAPPPKKIHERSKKAVTQQIGFVNVLTHSAILTVQAHRFCDSVARKPAKVVSCKWTDRIVTFLFKYRPFDLLRANGIAPPLRDKGKRKASPIPKCEMSDEDDSDAEEARMLETRLSEIRAKRAQKNPKKRKIKEEDEAELIDLTRPKKKIKIEDSRVKAEEKAQLIDLTNRKKRIKTEDKRAAFVPGEVIDLT